MDSALSTKAKKSLNGKNHKRVLPIYVMEALKALIIDIECFGPTLGLRYKDWPHFGPLGEGVYHCHLLKSKIKGNPSTKKEKAPAMWHVGE